VVEAALSRYRCTVTVEDITLHMAELGSAKLAVRWLHDRAVQVAETMEAVQIAERRPSPVRQLRAADALTEAPVQLRLWAQDPAAQRLAQYEAVVTGRTRLTVCHGSVRYWLAAQRIASVRPAQARPIADTAARIPRGRHRHPRATPARRLLGAP
jgi:hypothetical protein